MTNQKIKAIILVNLGSPDRLEVRAIRKFLQNFLSDKRVIGLPRLLWIPILYGVILPFRSSKLLKKYREIWHNKSNSSPLVHYTKLQANNLSQMVTTNDTIIRYAFSYSTPIISDILDELHTSYDLETLRVIPLYPQFSSTTTAPIFDKILGYYKTKKSIPSISILRGFADNVLYIDAVVNKIKKSFEINGRGEKLIFSYHSLPVAIINAGDTYYDECFLTTKHIVKLLGLETDEWVITFQSKFGANKWLSPVTTDTLCDLAKSGIKSIDIVCPGFVSDCLETLEEIAIMNKDKFLVNGGVHYNYISCINDSELTTKLLYNLC